MKHNIVGLIVATLVGVSQGAAWGQSSSIRQAPQQEVLVGDAMDDLPGFAAPDEGALGSDLAEETPVIPNPAEPSRLEPIPQPIDGNAEGNVFAPGPGVRMLDCMPAVTESTGTWLRRGFWYAEMDAVIFSRIWNPDVVVLAGETTSTRGTGTFTPPAPVFNALMIDETDPGADGLPRLTLGKFLFRDGSNRDHLAELTWFGGGQWTQQGRLQALNVGTAANGLQVPDYIDGNNPNNALPGNPSFDGAAAMDYRYDTHLDSIEVNYVVRQRMRRDQMVLQPDGQWVRRAWPSRTWGFLAGIRFVNLREALAWNATGIPDGDGDGIRETGRYFITTDNNLLGTQVGFNVTRDTARWSVGLDAKIGGFWNPMDMNSAVDISGGVSNARGNGTSDGLAVIAEASLIGRWHLTPSWSIRAGGELLWIESIALAPHHLNFIPGGVDTVVDTGGNMFLGTSIGIESYW